MKLIHFRVLDQRDTLVFIHIGKCGGASLMRAIKESEVLLSRFSTICKVHVEKPPLFTNSRYLVVVRNPIERAISAFNWRYKLVVEEGVQRDRFSGEWEVLTRYGSLENLANDLYCGGNLNYSAAANFRCIHHLREDISFYLKELLKHIDPEQLFAVLSTETLDLDMRSILGVVQDEKTHQNGDRVIGEKRIVSQSARSNLKKFLVEDYFCLGELLSINHATACNRSILLS